MLHEESGRIFREQGASRFELRGSTLRRPARVLILDPIVGSRFALARVVAQPGVLAETAATVEEARQCIARGGIALVLVEDELGGDLRGLDFLVELRANHPEVLRALLVAEDSAPIRRADIDRAGLAFLIARPWDPAQLRGAIRESLGLENDFSAWSHRTPVSSSAQTRVDADGFSDEVDRRLDLIARGLLAGLNSCEVEAEVFELLHAEMAIAFGSQRWLWVDEDRDLATRIVGDWPLEGSLRLANLPENERVLLDQARRSSRVTRLDRAGAATPGEHSSTACLGFTVKDGGRRSITALVWVAGGRSSAALALLREIHSGLQLAFRRIRDAEARALSARRLARRVSEELRTPVGALSHAIDRLRGEALRAGMSTEWVDRVSSESERLARAVERFEDEILPESGERHAVVN
jgi:DNA-binding response OmpR family regulator